MVFSNKYKCRKKRERSHCCHMILEFVRKKDSSQTLQMKTKKEKSIQQVLVALIMVLVVPTHKTPYHADRDRQRNKSLKHVLLSSISHQPALSLSATTGWYFLTSNKLQLSYSYAQRPLNFPRNGNLAELSGFHPTSKTTLKTFTNSKKLFHQVSSSMTSFRKKHIL